MKKLITLLISCSFALAISATAQQEDASPAPNKKQQRQEHREKRAAAAQGNTQAPAAQAEQPAARPHAGRKAKDRAAAMENNSAQAPAADATTPNGKANANALARKERQAARQKAATAASATDATATTPNAKVNAQTRKERRAGRQSAAASEAATPAPAAKANAKANVKAQAAPAANTAPANAQATNTSKNGKPKRPANIQKIRAAHASFSAQPKPQQIKSVTYNQNYTIENSQNWRGERYSAFRSYRPQRHDLGYYRSHYQRVELIAGGYYYFNAGYWYPAFTTQSTGQYYAYNGPIYAGRQALPPDRVIADVQASLQEMGYYKGEVDGLLGPLTREALTGYQSDNGLYTTAAIDEPTLDSLGMGS
ncbi:MAG: peptidoglycan-binding domain-containing protein [Chthoniobacterales bacterium]